MMENPWYERLMNASLRFVSYRPRSEREFREFLEKKLKKWDVAGEGLLSKVIIRMEELGYVDDRKFAEWWVDQRTSFKPKGNRLISLELRQKGVSEATIRAVLASRGSESLVTAARRAVGRKRFKTPRQFYNFLARRGFDAETIKRVEYELHQ